MVIYKYKSGDLLKIRQAFWVFEKDDLILVVDVSNVYMYVFWNGRIIDTITQENSYFDFVEVIEN